LDKDGDLPAALRDWLAQGDPARQFAVLHLFGSHYDYAERYPPEFQRFSGGDPLVDAYDNSILYTDHVLALLIDELDRRQEPAVLFYASDHGENLNDSGDGNLHHACRDFTRYEIEVPMIFYANRAFADAHPGRLAAIRACASLPVSHDNLSHTLLGLAGLGDPQVHLPAYDLSQAPYAAQPRFLITSLRDHMAEEVIRATPQGRGD
jgi:glucan phosphoethanolaminetransferase (alkaline phosphatase superfamily)